MTTEKGKVNYAQNLKNFASSGLTANDAVRGLKALAKCMDEAKKQGKVMFYAVRIESGLGNGLSDWTIYETLEAAVYYVKLHTTPRCRGFIYDKENKMIAKAVSDKLGSVNIEYVDGDAQKNNTDKEFVVRYLQPTFRKFKTRKEAEVFKNEIESKTGYSAKVLITKEEKEYFNIS